MLVVTSRRKRPVDSPAVDGGVAVITIPDIRWQRCHIESVALLPNVLGKQRAKEPVPSRLGRSIARGR